VSNWINYNHPIFRSLGIQRPLAGGEWRDADDKGPPDPADDDYVDWLAGEMRREQREAAIDQIVMPPWMRKLYQDITFETNESIIDIEE
jgi:hypothetical protein